MKLAVKVLWAPVFAGAALCSPAVVLKLAAGVMLLGLTCLAGWLIADTVEEIWLNR